MAADGGSGDNPRLWLAAHRIRIEEQDLGRDDDLNLVGYVFARLDEGEMRVGAVISLGTAARERQRFEEWAASRLQRFLEHGPEPDGWQERTGGGGWQLWARWYRDVDPWYSG